MHRWRVVFAVALVDVLALAPPAVAGLAWSAHAKRSAKPKVLHVDFRPAGTSPAVTNGNYTFFTGSSRGGSLLDERSGRRVTVPAPPNCAMGAGAALIGSTSLLESGCGSDPQSPTFALYPIQGGPWTSTSALAVSQQCQTVILTGPGSCEPVALGAHWIEVEEQCYHCTPVYKFQNIQTGQILNDPTTATTYPNLDTTKLGQRVCDPIVIGKGGAIIPDGRFVVVFRQGSSPAYTPGSGSYHLSRCGRSLDIPTGSMLGAPGMPTALIAVSPHMVVWVPAVRQAPYLKGVLLPSLRRIIIPLPYPDFSVKQIALSSRHLYVYTYQGTLWSGRLP